VLRGELYTIATGSGFGGKPRPALVLQADDYTAMAHVIVALIESPVEDPQSFRVPVSATKANGLKKDSMVALDLLVTVKQHQFGKRCGIIEPAVLEHVERMLLTLLGFARYSV
jgi:mRNA interferase MazF